jgi:phosphoglycerol transferase
LLVNENDVAALGIVGSIGFLLLLGRLLRKRDGSLGDGLSLLTLFAVLLSVRGGFSGLIALRFAWIRGYNRISVLIGFFALFAVVLGLENIRRRYARSPRAKAIFLSLLGLLLAAGLMDQTPRGSVTPADRIRPTFDNDVAFIRRIEASTPAHAMIFQLPYVSFPEQGSVQRMGDYELLRAYLHSRTLRWTHGAMRGREGDSWQRAVAGSPLVDMIATLTEAGFAGIYIDRFGYADRAASLENTLRRLLSTPPLVSDDGRLSYFPLIEPQDLLAAAR